MKHKKALLLCAVFLVLGAGLFLVPHTGLAEGTTTFKPITPRLSIPIPEVSFTPASKSGDSIAVNYLGQYIDGIYRYVLSISVILVIVMGMVGGVQYVLAAGSGSVETAKKRIRSAVEGLILLSCAYVILFTVNPALVRQEAFNLEYIAVIPEENLIHNNADLISCKSSNPGDLYGVNKFQDCMLKNYGESEQDIRDQLVEVEYNGPTKRTYKVHEKIAADFEAALAAATAAAPEYDLGRSSAGGTFNFRCNRNLPAAISSHGWGTGIDINPDTNPNCPKGCRTGGECKCVGGNSCEALCRAENYDVPQGVIDAFKANGFSWGGDYSNTKDYMHFTYTKVCKGG